MQPLSLIRSSRPGFARAGAQDRFHRPQAGGARLRRPERDAKRRRHRRHAVDEVSHVGTHDRAPLRPRRVAKGRADGPAEDRPGHVLRRRVCDRLDDPARGSTRAAGASVFVDVGLALAYIGIGVKLVLLGLSHDPPLTLKVAADQAASGARPDLLDRNGEILATDVKTMSVFAEPRRIIDKDEAVELITAVLPDIDAKELRERLGSKKGFVWVKRQVTEKEQQEIFHLGLPGVGFFPENKRVYPNGPVGAHVIGFVDKDNIGIAGMEKYLDNQSLTDPHVAGFSIDPD